MNLSSQTIDTLAIMNNKQVVEIIYEFLKVKTQILDLSAFDPSQAGQFTHEVAELQKEIKKNKNRNDNRVKKLEELLKDVFERLSISNLDELTEELKKAVEEARAINAENDRVAAIYGGHYSFVKTFTESVLNYEVDRSSVEELLLVVYDYLKDKMTGDTLVVQGRLNFVKATQKAITPILFKSGLYGKVKGCLGDVLTDLYTNIQLFM